MANAAKRWWKYLGAKANTTLDDRADPRVQLEQAMAEAQDQHRRLKEQAANVIANQRQAELRLNRSMEEYERLTANARQALLMADQAARAGDADRSVEYTATAEAFANRLVAVEQEVEDTKSLVLQSAQAAEQAKAAVAQNATLLQKKLAERQKLLGQLDQAKMQEQVNRSVASLNDTVGEDVPTLAEVREKIDLRYARAKGMAELQEHAVPDRMLEVEQAALNAEAVARLDALREQLGLPMAQPPVRSSAPHR